MPDYRTILLPEEDAQIFSTAVEETMLDLSRPVVWRSPTTPHSTDELIRMVAADALYRTLKINGERHGETLGDGLHRIDILPSALPLMRKMRLTDRTEDDDIARERQEAYRTSEYAEDVGVPRETWEDRTRRQVRYQREALARILGEATDQVNRAMSEDEDD
jgi:hypothetical protein